MRQVPSVWAEYLSDEGEEGPVKEAGHLRYVLRRRRGRDRRRPWEGHEKDRTV